MRVQDGLIEAGAGMLAIGMLLDEAFGTLTQGCALIEQES